MVELKLTEKQYSLIEQYTSHIKEKFRAIWSLTICVEFLCV